VLTSGSSRPHVPNIHRSDGEERLEAEMKESIEDKSIF
jgi:hypothetical protein